MPTTVMFNSPLSRPFGVSPSWPLATAIRSPCWMRDWPDLDAAVSGLDFTEALGPAVLARKFRSPLSVAVTSALEGLRREADGWSAARRRQAA